MFAEIINEKIFQAKNACEIQYRTDSVTSKTYVVIQKIIYSNGFPGTLNFTINYKGVNYAFSCSSSEVVNKANSYLGLKLGFVQITVGSNYITFIKRFQNEDDFTIITNDDCSLINLTGTNPSVINTTFPIRLIIQDDAAKTLAELKKSIPTTGIAIFDISSIIKANLYHDALTRSAFVISPTNLFKAFKIYAETLSSVNAYNEASIFGMNTDLNDDDLNYFLNGNPLLINNSLRYVADDSNEKIFYYKKTNTNVERLRITAYTINRRRSETYSTEITNLAKNAIYEIPTNWNSVKNLFTTIDIDDIVEYTVSWDVNVVIKWTVNYKRKEFLNKKEFLYINKFSAWDNIIFEAKNEKNINIEQDIVESKQKLIPISKKVYEKQKQNTGFISSEEHREQIKDFLSSQKVYEIINGKLVEIIISADNYLIKQLESSELLNIQFEYTYTNLKRVI